MTLDQINRLLSHARTLLAEHESGKRLSRHVLHWARRLIAQNPAPKVEA